MQLARHKSATCVAYWAEKADIWGAFLIDITRGIKMWRTSLVSWTGWTDGDGDLCWCVWDTEEGTWRNRPCCSWSMERISRTSPATDCSNHSNCLRGEAYFITTLCIFKYIFPPLLFWHSPLNRTQIQRSVAETWLNHSKSKSPILPRTSWRHLGCSLSKVKLLCLTPLAIHWASPKLVEKKVRIQYFKLSECTAACLEILESKFLPR